MSKMDVYKRLNELGIKLPVVPKKNGALIALAKPFLDGKLVYVSGCGSKTEATGYYGKFGDELSLEKDGNAARMSMLNLLAALEQQIGDLNRVKSFVKILVFVASSSNFYNQPDVANYASSLLIDIFGEKVGCAARSAIATNALPGNIAVEIEALVEIN